MSTVAVPRAAEKVAPSRRSTTIPIAVTVLLCLSIAAYFWIDSRYPSLLKKLHSGQNIHVSGPISFDALLPVTPQMPLATRIGHTTVDWLWTNRIGMSFGIVFGAAVLTLLPMLSRRRFRSATANTLVGALTGVPLGVCANCVAPIGQSLYQAGSSPGTMLAAMFASPTLNVVVLAMLFALFPFPLALLRLCVPLALIALVPWMTRRIEPVAVSACALPNNNGWIRGAGFTVREYLKNLGRLALSTVPFMILAGFLGALMIEVLPATAIPAKVSVLGIVAIALLGTFLPVPIAFDVAASFLLFSNGVPLPYVATLLCTLGAFSIYSVLILGKTISWRTAVSIFGVVACVGAAAGILTALVQQSF